MNNTIPVAEMQMLRVQAETMRERGTTNCAKRQKNRGILSPNLNCCP